MIDFKNTMKSTKYERTLVIFMILKLTKSTHMKNFMFGLGPAGHSAFPAARNRSMTARRMAP